MITGRCCLLFFGLILTGAFSELPRDFQDSFWSGVLFVYHGTHELLLVIDDNTNACYFNHVNNKTITALQSCHKNYMEEEIYDSIMFANEHELKATSLDAMRELYSDVLANFRCADKKIYTLQSLYGQNYIVQCPEQEWVSVGK